VIATSLLFGTVSVGHATTPPNETTPDTLPADGAAATPPVDETTPGADAGGFAVQPSGANGPGGRDYFIYTLKVGEVYGDTVAISNLGTETATFAIYATDAQNTDDGSFSLLREEDDPTDVGSWVEVGATQYTVEPGSRVDIPFKVTVPADVAPGDHVGAIVAQKIDDPDNPDDGIGFDVRVRIGARIYVRVDGPVSPSLAIDDFVVSYAAPGSPFSGDDIRILYTLTNTGDIRLSPTASLKVAGAFGIGEQALPDRQIPELLPGGSVQIAEVVRDVRPYLRLTTSLTVVSANESVAVNTSLSQWAIPYLVLVALGLVILGVVGRRIWMRRRHATAST
jgi:hypothetical protein